MDQRTRKKVFSRETLTVASRDVPLWSGYAAGVVNLVPRTARRAIHLTCFARVLDQPYQTFFSHPVLDE